MAPRSARKRKSNEADASAPGRRKKREDTPMKTAEARTRDELTTSDDASANASPLLTLSASGQAKEGEATSQGPTNLSLSLDQNESQMMGTLDESPSGEPADELLPLILETQYEDDEDDEDQEDGSAFVAADEDAMAYAATDADEDAMAHRANDADDRNEEAKEEGGDYRGEQADEDEQVGARESLVSASASIEEILQQLAEVASNFMTNFQELTAEGEAIQSELNQLNEAQEARCAKMLSRLERAGNSIFSFGQQQDDNDLNAGDESQAGQAESQEMAV